MIASIFVLLLALFWNWEFPEFCVYLEIPDTQYFWGHFLQNYTIFELKIWTVTDL